LQCPRIVRSLASRPTKLPARRQRERQLIALGRHRQRKAGDPRVPAISLSLDTEHSAYAGAEVSLRFSHTPSGVVVAGGRMVGAGVGAALDDEVFPQPQRVIVVSSGTMAVRHVLMARTAPDDDKQLTRVHSLSERLAECESSAWQT
jgi:hypothetical protein